MATAVEKAFSGLPQKAGARRAAKIERSLPPVDPDSTDLTDLFEWGAAVAKAGRLTPARSKEIIASVRKNAKNRR